MRHQDHYGIGGETYHSDNLMKCGRRGREFCYRCGDSGQAVCTWCLAKKA